jgi:hypothetical protein
MTLIPEVQSALCAAVARSASSPARRGRIPMRRGLLIAAATILVSTSALAAATHWSPQLGDSRRGHPTVANASIPADQLAALAVLRRPQTDADRGPAVLSVLKLLGKEESGGIHLDGVRLLATHSDGGALILIPAQRSGSHDRGHPSDVQRNTLLLLSSNHRSAGGTRGTVSDLRAGRISMSSLRNPVLIGNRPDGFVAEGLVPDGVVKVEVTLRGGIVKTAAVYNNSYEIPTGKQAGGLRTRWQHADGHFSKPR